MPVTQAVLKKLTLDGLRKMIKPLQAYSRITYSGRAADLMPNIYDLRLNLANGQILDAYDGTLNYSAEKLTLIAASVKKGRLTLTTSG
jgi:hypothetical protein